MKRAGFLEVVTLRRPHLVLAHTGGDDRVALRHLVKLFDDILWLDGILGVLECHRMIVLPASIC